ncbi:MAG TPA: trypsin-like peptidase domain-containing protein [Bryobacteraceae bacterium]|jgi:serine protease Do|nr:trypsin-like peptidase domain-containing protein [Bryobacteraceae bacterium]
MGCRTALIGCLIFAAWAPAGFAQDHKLNAIENFSASLESLSDHVNASVVKIVTTGFGISDDSDSGNAAMLTRQRATGSGVILTPDGYIVTNAHVIQGARRIRVQLPVSARAARLSHSITKPAGRVLDARVVGQDRETDVAVLKVDAADLPFLNLGDSRELRQGQLVMAFGSPLGLENSVSLGVVSATARQLKADSPMIYIQTDASINPGNSGGPLVDMSGRVVGLNTLILSQSGGSEGIGFAVPSDTLRNAYTQIRKEGHVHRGQIGASVETVTPLLASGLALPQDWGVLVSDVTPDGSADQCGLKAGDIVLTLDGKPMENARQLEVNLWRFPVGDKVSLEVLRGQDHLTMDVPVTALDDDPQRFADMVDPAKNLIPKLGILGVEIDRKLAALVPDLRKQFGIVVAARAAGAESLEVDLRPGDVIYAINTEPTSSIAALTKALDQMKSGEGVVLQIERDGQLKYVSFEME